MFAQKKMVCDLKRGDVVVVGGRQYPVFSTFRVDDLVSVKTDHLGLKRKLYLQATDTLSLVVEGEGGADEFLV